LRRILSVDPVKAGRRRLHGVLLDAGGWRAFAPAAKVLPDQLERGVRIEIAHDSHDGPLWAVPLLIKLVGGGGGYALDRREPSLTRVGRPGPVSELRELGGRDRLSAVVSR